MNRLLLSACLFAMPVLTLAASHDIKTFIGEHDLDHDGIVSKEEFEQERVRLFAALDADDSGGVSHDEYVGEYRTRLMSKKPEAAVVERQMKQAEVRFTVLDSNRDGQISWAEYTYSGWTMFAHHDYTKDGAISAKDDVDPPARAAAAAQKP